jgi:hypothetical protein
MGETESEKRAGKRTGKPVGHTWEIQRANLGPTPSRYPPSALRELFDSDESLKPSSRELR